jgi:hypothetical protein
MISTTCRFTDDITALHATLDRNLMSVRNHARKIGTPFPPMRVLRKNLADTSSRLWRYVATRATTAQI